ncbi:hypothetical protein Pint_21951 [Pistacia integerrima]|uniref:Uncharacterized protein n=1 Tax=Pistacia integerrima TaxID=434235 RepID=A0ACC0YLN2_9ROSI|nr:hypothetical protein Pint_21951 [Pistacia integerrima]
MPSSDSSSSPQYLQTLLAWTRPFLLAKHIRTAEDVEIINATLWPEDGKPGLWMNSLSRMGAIDGLIVREEENFLEERKRAGVVEVDKERDGYIELVVLPVFENFTIVLGANEHIESRDLYSHNSSYNHYIFTSLDMLYCDPIRRQ